jgi:metal-sulfur cluster biosynthetic enzyme
MLDRTAHYVYSGFRRENIGGWGPVAVEEVAMSGMPRVPEGPPDARLPAVLDALARCYDPCCKDKGISVLDLGVVSGVRFDGDEVGVDLTLTTGWCPFSMHLFTLINEEVGRVPGVGTVDVKVVWDTPWTADRMTTAAREKLSLPLIQLLPLREARLRREKEAATNVAEA